MLFQKALVSHLAKSSDVGGLSGRLKCILPQYLPSQWCELWLLSISGLPNELLTRPPATQSSSHQGFLSTSLFIGTI